MRVIGGHQNSDPAHWRNHFYDCPVIKLDGKVVTRCCEADDVEGFVVIEVYENGRLKLDATGEEVQTERRHGQVEIIGPAIAAQS